VTVPAGFAGPAPPGRTAPEAAALLEVRGLTVSYARRSGRRGSSAEPEAKAVRDVAMSVSRGETLGLVGESGSGKTSIGLAVLNLIPAAGSVVFDGEEIIGLLPARMRPLRRRMQMVFQDPTASLDPRMTVRRIISMSIRAHDLATGPAVDQLVASTLEKVSLSPVLMDRYPHQLSGGQRQRVSIARALATSPDFIVCDEITSSLDVSVQAQVVNLLMDLQADLGLTLLFISHNLGIVRQVSSTIAVLYLGRVMEAGPAEAVYAHAAHPYTRALLEAVPSPDPAVEAHRSREFLQADAAAPRTLAVWSGGCVYRARCPFATEVCREVEPELAPTPAGHLVACHHAEEIRLGTARRGGDDA
jgi:oligopeptide/dipeptide ABC transporter ATP-binding protein